MRTVPNLLARLSLVLCALGAVLPAAALAQSPQPRRIVVGVPHPNHGRGLADLDADFVPFGFAIDVLRAAFAHVGYEVEFKSLHLEKNVIAAFETKGVDLVAPFQVSEHYMRVVDYSGPIVVCRGAVFSRTDGPAPDLDRLRAARIIVARAGTAHEWCLLQGVPCQTAETLAGAFEALAAGEYEYLITTQIAGRVEIPKMGLRTIVEHPLPDDAFDEVFAAAFRPAETQLTVDLNRGLAELRETGQYDRLYDKWLAELQPRATPVRITSSTIRNILIGAVVVLLAATIAVGMLARSLARRRRDLAQSEARYRLITEASPALVYQYGVSRDGRRSLVYANPNLAAWQRLFPSLDLNRPYEQTIFNDIHPDDRAVYAERSQLSRRTGEQFDVEFRLRDATGQFRWVHSVAIASPGPDGVIWNGLLLDLTEQRRTAEELARSQQRYREIFECSHDAILVYDAESGMVVAANERAAELYGYVPDELIGLSVSRLSDDWVDVQRRARDLLATRGHANYHLRQRRSDGTIVEVDVSASVIELDGRTLVLSLNRDISDRVHAQARLHETQVLLQAAIDGADLGIWVIDLETDEITVDAGLLRFFGFDLPPGRYSRFMFIDRVAPADRDEIALAYAASRDRHVRYETRFRVHRPAQSGDGIDVRWLSSRGAVQFDSVGRAVRLVGATIDITEAQLAEEERKRFEETRAHTARLESLGVLAGGIAHDFNNLLVGILGNASMAQSMVPPDHPTAPILSQLVNAGNRAADLTRQLLAYAGKARLRTEPLDLAAVVAEMPGLLGPRLGPGAVLAIEPAAEPVAIVGDLTQVRQAVMNLIVNAADAIGEDQGRIAVRTHLRDFTEDYLRQTPPPTSLSGGRYACVEVADSAGTLDLETLERIFDPFFSTKFTGRGLGLSVVLATMKRHAGAVKVEVVRGVETRFVLIFPATTFAGAGGRSVVARPGLPPGRLLLVDDESIVRQTVGEVLRLSGWNVVAVDSGEAAMRHFDRDPQFDAAVVDVTMPGMSGLELRRWLRSAAPKLPIVLTSGFAEESVLSGVSDPLNGFIPKPFEVSALLSAIDSLRLRRASGVIERTPGTTGSTSEPSQSLGEIGGVGLGRNR